MGTWQGERGAIAAEHVAFLVLVAAVIGAIWAAAVPERVEDAASVAADCLFRTDTGECDVTATVGDSATGDDSAAGDSGSDGPTADDVGTGGPVTNVDGEDAGAWPVVPVGASEQREADVHRQLQDEAAALRELADRDLDDLAVWDEIQELEQWRFGPTMLDDDPAEKYRRLEELRAELDAAPDGSLLAELRDTEHLRDPHRSVDDLDPLFDVLGRAERVEHAGQLADLLEGWADSDRRFVHLEVDLDDGTVRVAEVVRGDLDAASNVALVVPGTGNDGHNFDAATRENARALGESLELVPGGDDVAVIACLCYAPPPGLMHAAGSSHADAGGADLARIIGDLPVGDAQVHVLGHSYGSTALGRAVTRNGLEVDSTISLGGPGFGSGIQRVEDLPDTAGDVWGVRHDLDPIDLAGLHGRNPDRGGFGARGFAIGDDGIDRKLWKPYIFDAHSIYYQDAESLRNLALIVSGNPDEVTGYREGR